MSQENQCRHDRKVQRWFSGVDHRWHCADCGAIFADAEQIKLSQVFRDTERITFVDESR